jgi:hypothetical protein
MKNKDLLKYLSNIGIASDYRLKSTRIPPGIGKRLTSRQEIFRENLFYITRERY